MVVSKLGLYKIVSGAFGAFPKQLLMRLGGWDIGPGLDGDITVKIRKLRYKVLFEENALCLTHVPVTWKALTKQRRRWSRSLVRFRIRKHKDVWFPDRNFSYRIYWPFSRMYSLVSCSILCGFLYGKNCYRGASIFMVLVSLQVYRLFIAIPGSVHHGLICGE